jgi:diaminopimelate decarboxylase
MSAAKIADVLARAVASGAVSDAAPAAIFYDLTAFEAQCRSLVAAFPADALHGFAVKACPVLSVVRAAAAAGLGAECASIAEVAVARAAGIPGPRIIYDSPAKTDAHLRASLCAGVHVNADNLGEVARIAAVRRELGHGAGEGSVVGLRVNPQSGSASIAMTFTAGASSKFGVPLAEDRAGAVAAFAEHQFLSCIHVHVGSQGCSVDVLVRGAVAAVELADEVNAGRPGAVTSIDIGGGLSVDYDGDGEEPSFAEYAAALRAAVPALFDGRYRVLTEFGRKVAAKAAFVAARVQHVKRAGGRVIAVGHAGADIFTRPVYMPAKWSHRIEVMDATGGKAKAGDAVCVDIAGPLCFSGDMLAVGRTLPVPDAGDWLVVRDAGAYTLSLLNRHTSQLMPPVYGYRSADVGAPLEVLLKGETVEDIVAFWS